MTEPTSLSDEIDFRAAERFDEAMDTIARGNDRLFARLLLLQWLAGIALAVLVSPLFWTTSSTFTPVQTAIIVGTMIVFPPFYLAVTRPGSRLTRHTIAAAQMSIGAMLVYLCGGRGETHFHIFGSLALLAFYRNWRVLVMASAVAAADHVILVLFWPRSLVGGGWHWFELGTWVSFVDIFLIRSCVLARREMKEVAERRAQLEMAREQGEQTVREQSAALRVANLIERMRQCGFVEEAATVALEMIRASFEARIAVYRTADPVDGTLRFAMGTGPGYDALDQSLSQTRPRLGEGLAGQAWQAGDLVIVHDLKRKGGMASSLPFKAEGTWSGAAFPIRRPWGRRSSRSDRRRASIRSRSSFRRLRSITSTTSVR